MLPLAFARMAGIKTLRTSRFSPPLAVPEGRNSGEYQAVTVPADPSVQEPTPVQVDAAYQDGKTETIKNIHVLKCPVVNFHVSMPPAWIR